MSPTPDQPEAGREHLSRAVTALPTHAPADAVWPRIAGQLAIADATQALPEHEPEPGLWDRISARLDHPEPLPAALVQLPAHTPDDAVWAAIAARLDAPTRPPARVAPRPWWLRAARNARRRPVLAAVAVLLLVAGLWWQGPPRPAQPLASAPRETISYDVEVVTEAPSAPVSPAPAPPDALGLRGKAFIDAHCSSLPTVCQSARFQELRGQLGALETEEARLAEDLRRFGSQPELLRHQSRVTTQKAAMTRELIHLLIS